MLYQLSYVGVAPDSSRPRPAVPRGAGVVVDSDPATVDAAETRVLIADDVADTGATLALVKEFCAGRVAEVRCAVLYEKPHIIVHSEYVWRRTDRWITFPWSAEPPVGEARAAAG